MESTCNITTKHGVIRIELMPQIAPNTVTNFGKLVRAGFYDQLLFHRIVPGFVVQGGDPNSKDRENRRNWGTGGPGWKINAEFNEIKHSRGIVSMARSHDPDSAGSQFFIVIKDSYFLDGQYTAFGRVIEGMDIVDKIASISTDDNDAPVNAQDAELIKVTISD
ncbi:MAG TPA: peptidylprolyl isomerase [Nitrososphaeraceae archaeon]